MSAVGTVKKTKTAKYVPRPKKLPRFLTQLYSLMTSDNVDHVTWLQDSNGVYNTFRVEDSDAFAAEVLPRFFKHSNFLSFVRQLHIYGFRKVYVKGTDFINPFFVKGQPELMKQIKRNAKDNTERKYVKKNKKSKSKKDGASSASVAKKQTASSPNEEMLVEQVNMLQNNLNMAVHQANYATAALATLVGSIKDQESPSLKTKREEESELEQPSSKRRRTESTDSSVSTVSDVWPESQSHSNSWLQDSFGSSFTDSVALSSSSSIVSGASLDFATECLEPQLWSNDTHGQFNMFDNGIGMQQQMVSSPLSTTSMNSTQNLPASPYSTSCFEKQEESSNKIVDATQAISNGTMLLESSSPSLSMGETSSTLSDSISFDFDFGSMPETFQFSMPDDVYSFAHAQEPMFDNDLF